MHYVARVGQQELALEIEATGADTYRVHLGGQTHLIEVAATGPHDLSLRLGQRIHDLHFDAVGDGRQRVWLDGTATEVTVLDLRHQRLAQAQAEMAEPSGPQTICTPMAGKVVAVHVGVGQAVCAGDSLIVVEAMKMENELRAPRDGVVRAVTVEVGQAVDGGASLCLID